MERMNCKAEFFLTNFLADFTNKNPRILSEFSTRSAHWKYQVFYGMDQSLDKYHLITYKFRTALLWLTENFHIIFQDAMEKDFGICLILLAVQILSSLRQVTTSLFICLCNYAFCLFSF